MALLFDENYYLDINHARWNAILPLLSALEFKSCIDAGCGPGWFSERLCELSDSVIGLDGRLELVEEAARRVPKASFVTCDIASTSLIQDVRINGDLVFCLGLLYHLENPFQAIRNLQSMTRKYILIETQLLPSSFCDFRLVSEGENITQGLRYYSIVPSRSSLVHMLYASGFTHVYACKFDVNHSDFIDTSDALHRREFFLATLVGPIVHSSLSLLDNPKAPKICYNLK
jgi:trans-aconitate methyltransferase